MGGDDPGPASPSGTPAARLTGLPGELLLYLFGRQAAANVEVSGPGAAVEAVSERGSASDDQVQLR